jgi:hypothetical protein
MAIRIGRDVPRPRLEDTRGHQLPGRFLKRTEPPLAYVGTRDAYVPLCAGRDSVVTY